jgi:L-asparaginase
LGIDEDGAANVRSSKAEFERLLLMACLLNLGSVPTAADPANPTRAETDAVKAKLAEYRSVFDTH